MKQIQDGSGKKKLTKAQQEVLTKMAAEPGCVWFGTRTLESRDRMSKFRKKPVVIEAVQLT